MTPEEKRALGLGELGTLRQIWNRWLRSDCNWAAEIIVKQGGVQSEDEFDFLLSDWKEKFETWLYPYVERLWKTDHLTKEEAYEFSDWAYTRMDVALKALYLMEVEGNG